MRSSAERHRYRVLDAWRGICACLVTIVHIPVAHAWQNTNTFHNMQLFVDFFFVLSGFVICFAYGGRLERDGNWQGFMIRRFGRIYPLHLAVLAAFFGLEVMKWIVHAAAHIDFEGVAFTGPRSFATLLSNLLLTQSFNLHGMTSWNGPAWSIGVEFYTYAIFALAVLAFGSRSMVYVTLSLLGLAVVALRSPSWLFATHDFGFWRCLYGFFLGCLIAQFVAAGKEVTRLHGSSTFLEVGACAMLVVYLAIAGKDATSLAAPLIFSLIVLIFADERGLISKALLSKPAQALGAWSYSIYMIHMLLFNILKSVFSVLAAKQILPLSSPVMEPVRLFTLGSTGADLALTAAYLALVLLLAGFSYRWIETPARTYFARIADGFSPSPRRGTLAATA